MLPQENLMRLPTKPSEILEKGVAQICETPSQPQPRDRHAPPLVAVHALIVGWKMKCMMTCYKFAHSG